MAARRSWTGRYGRRPPSIFGWLDFEHWGSRVSPKVSPDAVEMSGPPGHPGAWLRFASLLTLCRQVFMIADQEPGPEGVEPPGVDGGLLQCKVRRQGGPVESWGEIGGMLKISSSRWRSLGRDGKGCDNGASGLGTRRPCLSLGGRPDDPEMPQPTEVRRPPAANLLQGSGTRSPCRSPGAWRSLYGQPWSIAPTEPNLPRSDIVPQVSRRPPAVPPDGPTC